ncbi:hypothetical protein F4824DRAFT_448113 [Ustulina deusta]|nr:hypothetical protein F4824DRAFT_448113 [Ustulina deusta]
MRAFRISSSNLLMACMLEFSSSSSIRVLLSLTNASLSFLPWLPAVNSIYFQCRIYLKVIQFTYVKFLVLSPMLFSTATHIR